MKKLTILAALLVAALATAAWLDTDTTEACGFEVRSSPNGLYWALYDCGSYVESSDVPIDQPRPTWTFNSACNWWMEDCNFIHFITPENRNDTFPTPVAYHRGTNREYNGACSEWHGTPGDPNDPPGGTCDFRLEQRGLAHSDRSGYHEAQHYYQPPLVAGSFWAQQIHANTYPAVTVGGTTYPAQPTQPNDFLWVVVGEAEDGRHVVVRCVYGLRGDDRAEAHAGFRNTRPSGTTYVGCGHSDIEYLMGRGYLVYEARP